MKIYIESNNDYLLLTDEFDKANIEDYYKKNELINNAMDKLEQLKLSMEIKRQKKGDYLVKKLGAHPGYGK